MSLRSTIQNRLGAQGYENIGEKRYAMQGYVANGDLEIEGALPWTRVPYFVCAITTGIGTALAYPTLLLAVMPLAFLGAVLPYNPLDYLYNYGIRRFTGTGKIPRQGNPRRFACGLAAAWHCDGLRISSRIRAGRIRAWRIAGRHRRSRGHNEYMHTLYGI